MIMMIKINQGIIDHDLRKKYNRESILHVDWNCLMYPLVN